MGRGVHLVVGYGTTEVGTTVADFSAYDVEQLNPAINQVPEDWEWVTIDRICKPRWVDQGDGTYELQLLVSHKNVMAPVFALIGLASHARHALLTDQLSKTCSFRAANEDMQRLISLSHTLPGRAYGKC